jgi:hypothetical protein
MTSDPQTNDNPFPELSPAPELRQFDRFIGSWKLSGNLCRLRRGNDQGRGDLRVAAGRPQAEPPRGDHLSAYPIARETGAEQRMTRGWPGCGLAAGQPSRNADVQQL